MAGAEGVWDRLDGIIVAASLKLDYYIDKL